MFMTFEGFTLTFVSRTSDQNSRIRNKGKDKMIVDICHMIECGNYICHAFP
jgi:hypothetical protein